MEERKEKDILILEALGKQSAAASLDGKYTQEQKEAFAEEARALQDAVELMKNEN